MQPIMQTYSSLALSYADPKPDQIFIYDVAVALSRMPRFAGHTAVPYSVAQHSVHVSWLVPRDLAKAALLHDAAEAYMLDIPTPLKQLLPDYRAIYDRVDAACVEAFGCDWRGDPIIKRADAVALATEKRDLTVPADWWGPGVLPDPVTIEPLPHQEALTQFMNRWAEVCDA